HGGPEEVVLTLKNAQPIGQRTIPEIGTSGNDHSSGFTASVRIDYSDATEILIFQRRPPVVMRGSLSSGIPAALRNIEPSFCRGQFAAVGMTREIAGGHISACGTSSYGYNIHASRQPA